MAIFFSVVLMDLGNLDADKRQEWKEASGLWEGDWVAVKRQEAQGL